MARATLPSLNSGASRKNSDCASVVIVNLSAFKRAIPWLRLALGIFCVALGLLPFVPAPTRICWLLAVGMTEWGHYIALLSLLPLLPGLRTSRPALVGAALGCVGICLALSTIVRASLLSGEIRAGVESAFGTVQPSSTENAPPRAAPLVWSDLVLGISCPPVKRSSVDFASPGGSALAMDVYTPPQSSSSKPAPVLVVIHGGAWRGGDRTELPRINHYLASRGYFVASVDYRLAPTFRFPIASEDVQAAIAYLKANATALNLDAKRIALLGRSAGGHLALLHAYTSNDPAIRGVVAIYSPTDLVYAYDHPCNPRVLDSTAVLESFLGGNPGSLADAYRSGSPLNFVKFAAPPTLLIHGDRDDVVPVVHSERLDQRLTEAGVKHYFLRIPWGNHGCDANLSGPGGQLSLYAIERFLAAVLR